MRSNLQWISLAIGLALQPSCGGETGAPESEPATGGSVGGKSDDPTPPTPPALPARYGLRVQSDVETRSRTSGATGAYTVAVVGVASVTQDGVGVGLSVQACRATLPVIADRQPTVDEGTLQALAPVVSTGALSPASPEGGWRLALEPAAVVLGARLEHPLTDALPTDGADSRVVDEDGDRKPGMSIRVSGFKVYGAIRVVLSQLAGILGADLGTSGAAHLEPSYEIYGDSIPFFDAKAAADQARADTEITAQHDRFWLVPLGAAATCADVQDSLFP